MCDLFNRQRRVLQQGTRLPKPAKPGNFLIAGVCLAMQRQDSLDARCIGNAAGPTIPESCPESLSCVDLQTEVTSP